MASKKQTGEGGGTTAMALPEGYTTGKHKHYGAMVALRFSTLPAGGMAPVRLLLLASKETRDEQVRELLANPRMQLEMKAPGVWAASARMSDMDALVGPNTGAGKMFRYVDLAHRLYGLPVAGAGERATVCVSYDGSASDAKKKLKALGMTLMEPEAPEGAEPDEWVNPDEGSYVGTVMGGGLAEMIATAKVLAVEVREVMAAGAGQPAGA